MERWFQLSYTPTYSLSLLIESETTTPTFLRFLSKCLLFSRNLLLQSSSLRQALENELILRPSLSESEGLISSSALRVVDNAYYVSRKGNFLPDDWIISQEDILTSLTSTDKITEDEPIYTLLETSIERILLTYKLVNEVEDRSQVSFATDGTDDHKLRELFSLLKPSTTLSGLISKQWQDIGYQGTSPLTDLRALNILALDSYLYFAREYGNKAVEMVQESVEGGLNWYPLALASIHMTSFALDLAKNRDLQLILLRSYQFPSDSFPLLTTPTTNNNKESDSKKMKELKPFLNITAELLVLFHENWLRGGYTVMQFESVSKEFQSALRPWIRRGIIDGRGLGWSKQVALENKKSI